MAPRKKASRQSNQVPNPLTDEDRIALFRSMVQIREFEEQVQRSYLEGLVHGTTHLCNGH